MVKDLYARLGFTVTEIDAAGAGRAVLAMAGRMPTATPIAVKAG